MTFKTIIDKGPKDPGPEPALPAGVASTPEHDAWKAAVKETEDWKKVDEGKPRPVTMDAVDADHAIAADPARYQEVLKTRAELRAALRARMTIEARVAALEAAYDEMVAEAEGETEDVEPAPAPVPPLFGPAAAVGPSSPAPKPRHLMSPVEQAEADRQAAATAEPAHHPV